jgi:hypothetical protein
MGCPYVKPRESPVRFMDEYKDAVTSSVERTSQNCEQSREQSREQTLVQSRVETHMSTLADTDLRVADVPPPIIEGDEWLAVTEDDGFPVPMSLVNVQ